MRHRALLIAGAFVVAVLAGGWFAWRSIPYEVPEGQRASPASVARQMAYVERYWQHGNGAFGSLGGTDCVNFTSQALHARGWPMTAEWGHSQRLGRHAYTRTWISSTAFRDWLAGHPDLAVALGDDRRDAVRVGDIVQFDWDRSGDRDHTAVVSEVAEQDGEVLIRVAQHSPAGLRDSVDDLIDAHGGAGTIHYWSLRE